VGFTSFKATETSLFWWLCCSSFMFECLGFYTILGFSEREQVRVVYIYGDDDVWVLGFCIKIFTERERERERERG
jgi:hypothetical protein